MKTFSALLAICAGNSPVPGEFPKQRPVTRSFDVYFDLRPNKRLGKQSWGWWFETLSCSLWRPRNECYKYHTVKSIGSQLLLMIIIKRRKIINQLFYAFQMLTAVKRFQFKVQF